MGVSIPSDLVLDVMQNADPARLRKAVAAFQSYPTDAGTQFAQVMDTTRIRHLTDTRGSIAPHAEAVASPENAAARNFERMILRNLFEPLLPSADSGAFGEGPSAAIWRSLAADELAGAAVRSGGFGLTELVTVSPGSGIAETAHGQWPYFTASPITSFAG